MNAIANKISVYKENGKGQKLLGLDIAEFFLFFLFRQWYGMEK